MRALEISKYHNMVKLLDVLRLLRSIDQHQPSLAELCLLLGWSKASIKRCIGLCRRIGIEIETVQRPGSGSVRDCYYVLNSAGPFDLAAAKRLWRRLP